MEEDKTLNPLNNLPVEGKSYTLDETAEYNDPDRDTSGDLPQPVQQAAYDYKPAWQKDVEDGFNVKLGEDLNGNDIVRTRGEASRISATRQEIVQDKQVFKEYSALNDKALAGDTNQYRDVAYSKSIMENMGTGIVQFYGNVASGFLSGIASWDLRDGVGMITGEDREYGNIFQSLADNIREATNEHFRIYEKNPGGVEFGDSAWWATQLGQFGTSVGIGAEALLETALISYATGGMGTMSAVAKGVNTAVRLRKLAQAGKLARFLKGSKALSKGVNTAIKAGTWGAWKGAQEGIIEGYESYTQTYQEYLDKGLSPKEAQKLASIAASTTYKEGVVPLMALNALQWATMAINPMTGATSSKLLNKIGNKTLRGAVDTTTSLLSEGAEELIQGFAQQSGEDAAAIAHGSLLERGKRSIGDKLGDEENWNAFIGGLFGGAAFRGMGYVRDYKSIKIGKERAKNYAKDTGKIHDHLKKMHKGVEELVKAGKSSEAALMQRKTNMYHTAAMINLDETYNKEAGYEGIVDHYEAALKYANENDVAALKEMGITEDSIDYIKETYPDVIADTKSIAKTYKEALKTNEPEFAKDIAYNTAKIKADKEFLNKAEIELKEFTDGSPVINFSTSANKEVLDKEGEINHFENQIKDITTYQKKLKVGSPEFFMAEKQKEEIIKQKEEVEKQKQEIISENSEDADFNKNQKELNKVDKTKYFSLIDTKKTIEEDVENGKKEINKISSPKYQEDFIRERDYIKGMSSTNSKEIAEMLIELERKYYLNDERGIKIKEELASRITDINANTLKSPVTKKEETKVRNLDEEDKTEVQKEVEKVADLDSIERKKNAEIIKEAIAEVNEKIEKNKEAKNELEETLILLDLILDDTLFNSKEKIDALVDKLDGMKLLNKKIKGAIKSRLANISKETNKEVRDQLQAEFRFANETVNLISEFTKELEQLESIEKDLLKQVDYYNNLIANKNLTTLDLNDLEKVQDKLERKISTVRKLIKGIKDAINQTKQYLKEYFKSLKKALPEGTNVDDVLKSVDNISEMTPEELSDLMEKQNTLGERATQALEGVVNSEEMAEVESKRRQELEEALTKYDNQLRYLNELIDKAILADEVIKEEIKEDIAEIKGKPELTEKQRETQEILIDVIENSRKFGDPETVDGKSFYKKGKELFERVSNYIANKFGENQITKENEAAKKGQAVGNFVDFIGRDIFKGEVVSREAYIKETNDYNQDKGNTYLLTDSSVSQEVFDSLVKIFTDTKNHLEKTGHTFLSDDMTVSSPIKEAIGKANGVAGTLDLIAINKEGVVQIIDFKNIVFNGSLTNTQHLDKVFTKTDTWTPKAEQWARQQTMYKRLLELAGLTVDTVNVLPISTEYKSEGNVITISKVKPLHRRKEEGYGLTKAVDKEGKYKISNLSENIIELEEHERTNDIMDNDFGTNEVIQEDFTQVIDESLFGNIEGAVPNQQTKQKTTNQEEVISEQDIVEKKSVLDNFLNDPSGYIYNQEELDTLVDEGVLEKDCD